MSINLTLIISRFHLSAHMATFVKRYGVSASDYPVRNIYEAFDWVGCYSDHISNETLLGLLGS